MNKNEYINARMHIRILLVYIPVLQRKRERESRKTYIHFSSVVSIAGGGA